MIVLGIFVMAILGSIWVQRIEPKQGYDIVQCNPYPPQQINGSWTNVMTFTNRTTNTVINTPNTCTWDGYCGWNPGCYGSYTCYAIPDDCAFDGHLIHPHYAVIMCAVGWTIIGLGVIIGLCALSCLAKAMN
jgi:hypothetical protein